MKDIKEILVRIVTIMIYILKEKFQIPHLNLIIAIIIIIPMATEIINTTIEVT
jgi:diacylglycerol kinase